MCVCPAEPGREATLEELSSRAASRLAGSSVQPSRAQTAMDTASATVLPGVYNYAYQVSSVLAIAAGHVLLSLAGESTFIASVFTQSGNGAPPVSGPSGRGLPKQGPTVDPSEPNDHPILKVVSSSPHQ